MRMPYTMNWSGGFQFQMTGTWLAELLYQGSAGVGLLNNWDINVVPLNVSTDRAQLDTIRTQYQNFKPYPQFGQIQHYSNYGHNTYHGMTLRVEKRYSSGMTINSFWTWSKTLEAEMGVGQSRPREPGDNIATEIRGKLSIMKSRYDSGAGG